MKKKIRFGKVEGQDVAILDRATKLLAKKGNLIIQSLKNGITAEVNKKDVKNITTKFPKKK